MFENIKPTDTTIEVALPFYIMSQISNIFYYANIKDKGLTMYDEKFGLALARKKPEIRSQYFKIQKTWHEKWITKYPTCRKQMNTSHMTKSIRNSHMILKHMDTVKPTFLKMTYGILLILFCTTKNPTRMSFEQKKMKSMCIRKSEAMYGDD